ncbi:MAG: hypothetical protein V9H69_11335 [Anaerolineae bacterium]
MARKTASRYSGLAAQPGDAMRLDADHGLEGQAHVVVEPAAVDPAQVDAARRSLSQPLSGLPQVHGNAQRGGEVVA